MTVLGCYYAVAKMNDRGDHGSVSAGKISTNDVSQDEAEDFNNVFTNMGLRNQDNVEEGY